MDISELALYLFKEDIKDKDVSPIGYGFNGIYLKGGGWGAIVEGQTYQLSYKKYKKIFPKGVGPTIEEIVKYGDKISV
jgi:hypothetical protein